MARFSSSLKKGAAFTVPTAKSIASGHDIWSDPNLIRSRNPALMSVITMHLAVVVALTLRFGGGAARRIIR